MYVVAPCPSEPWDNFSNAGQWRSLDIPLLCVAGRILFLTVDDFSLAGQRTLHKGTVLLVELAQDTQGGALVYHTATLPPSAGVTRAFSPRADVGDGAVGGGWLGQVLLGRG